VVVHNLTIIAIQAAAATEMVGQRPTDARRSLIAVRRAARQSLDEMRRFLDILEPNAIYATRDPLPGLERLDALAARFNSLGLHVTLTYEGRRRHINAGLGLSLYRVVEDALNESVRQGGAEAAVRVAYEPGVVSVVIAAEARPESTAPRARPPRGRFAGIRERVALFDGELTIRARPDGSFYISARFPTQMRGRRPPTRAGTTTR
jgi:signal transduction histidine kinase